LTRDIVELPLDARQSTLIEKVAQAPASYYGEQPDEKYRRMAFSILSKRGILREASKRKPNVDSLVG
jgi:hypothetical protein